MFANSLGPEAAARPDDGAPPGGYRAIFWRMANTEAHKPYARPGHRPEEVTAFRATGKVCSPVGGGTWEERHYHCNHVHLDYDKAQECATRIAGSYDRFGRLPSYATFDTAAR